MSKKRKRTIYHFKITPKPAVRLNKNTPGKKRRDYERYKKHLAFLAKEQGFKLGSILVVIFGMPMPKSWSQKKRNKYRYQPHQSGRGPDTDNLTKAIKDATASNDAYVYINCAKKIWVDDPVGYIRVCEVDDTKIENIFDFINE